MVGSVLGGWKGSKQVSGKARGMGEGGDLHQLLKLFALALVAIMNFFYPWRTQVIYFFHSQLQISSNPRSPQQSPLQWPR